MEFEVIVTRDATESAIIKVDAKDWSQATEKALDEVEEGKAKWDLDEISGSPDVYVTGCNEV